MVLSQLIENCTASTFMGQLRNRILTPLGALRVRVSPDLIGSQPADEAAYDAPQHDSMTESLWALNVGPSVRTAARPMVPYVYGADSTIVTSMPLEDCPRPRLTWRRSWPASAARQVLQVGCSTTPTENAC